MSERERQMSSELGAIFHRLLFCCGGGEGGDPNLTIVDCGANNKKVFFHTVPIDGTISVLGRAEI